VEEARLKAWRRSERQRLLTRHSEFRVKLEEKLAPERCSEVSSENAERVVALTLFRLDEEARVWEPRDQRDQGRRALIDHERDALIELAVMERSGKAEHGMCPNGQRARKAARKVDTNSLAQLGMRPNEGLDRPVADRQERARVGLHEHPECGATLFRLHTSRPDRVAQIQLLEIAPQMLGQAAIANQNYVLSLCHDHHRCRPLGSTA